MVGISVTIKHVPEEVVERLKQQAKEHHRSLQGELMAILEDAAGMSGRLTAVEASQRAAARGVQTPSSVELIRRMRDARYGG